MQSFMHMLGLKHYICILLNICLITNFEITSSNLVFWIFWNLHDRKWFIVITTERQCANLWLTLLEERNPEDKVTSGDFFTKHPSLSIWCVISVVFKPFFYRVLKIWSRVLYLPIQTMLLNILLFFLVFLRRGKKYSENRRMLRDRR